jgi:hypothetical protein
MTDIAHVPQAAEQDLRAHQGTFRTFSKLVLFSILHIALVLACLALAFLGNVPMIALLLGVGGSVLIITALVAM